MLKKIISLSILVIGVTYRALGWAVGFALLPDNIVQVWEDYLMDLSGVAWLVLVLGVMSTLYIFWPSLASMFLQKSEEPMAGDDRSIINNASNYGQQFTGDITFNVSNGYAVLSETEVGSLASKLSELSSVEVHIVGNQKCSAIGDALVEKLKSLGVNVSGVVSIGTQIPEPTEPYEISVSQEQSTAVLTIAPKAY